MTWIDLAVMQWVTAHRSPLGDDLAYLVMAAGTSTGIVAVEALVCLVAVVARRAYRLAAGVVLAVVVSAIGTEVLKQVVGRARPSGSLALVHADGLSMPSTDGALTAAAAMALFVGLGRLHARRRRLVGGALAAGVVGVGGCLVYLGAHWPTDVLAGWVLGAAIGTGAAIVTCRPRGRARGSSAGAADREALRESS